MPLGNYPFTNSGHPLQNTKGVEHIIINFKCFVQGVCVCVCKNACIHTQIHTLTLLFFFPRLYAIGGHDGSSCLKSMEYFDPHTNKWSLCASMSKRRGGVGVAAYNGFLYVAGGHDAPASSHCSKLSGCVER